jgi:phytoene dehydrogenase-like protein
VVVIGAGHNGLAAAIRLARAGCEVTVLEARDRPGGLCEELEFHPGYRAPAVLDDTASLRPGAVRALDLERHGLSFAARVTPVYAAEEGGPGLLLHRDPQEARAEIAARSASDAEAYVRWRAFLSRIDRLVGAFASEEPPPLGVENLADLKRIARRALGLRRLGGDDMVELLRVAPMCVADWLLESFETPLLVEALAAPAVVGSFMGPWSAGTAASLLLHECTVHREVRGGAPALVRSLLSAAEAGGVVVRTGSRVRRIECEDGAVSGVVLESGEAIEASTVAASCHPATTLLDLLAPGALELDLERQIAAYRSRGTTARMLLALRGPLEAAARPGERFAAIRIGGGHVDHLERAFDAVKYERASDRPHLEIRVPTVDQPDLAPAGHHVASVSVSFAPYEPQGGWTSAARDVLRDRALETMRPHFAGLDERIEAVTLLTPSDLERGWSLPGGQIHHGEQALDQLASMRPAPQVGRYRGPIAGLYLAGGGSHPGGGITAAPGVLAAAAILGDGRRSADRRRK